MQCRCVRNMNNVYERAAVGEVSRRSFAEWKTVLRANFPDRITDNTAQLIPLNLIPSQNLVRMLNKYAHVSQLRSIDVCCSLPVGQQRGIRNQNIML
jgi:hypothetical protein